MHSICTWICAGWQIFKVRGTFCQSSADLHKLFTYLSLLILAITTHFSLCSYRASFGTAKYCHAWLRNMVNIKIAESCNYSSTF